MSQDCAMLRERFAGDLREAIKAKDAPRVSTLRLICAAVKDREIAARVDADRDGLGDTEILAILAKMIRQREESARTYEEAGRLDLADQERGEIVIIRGYLPKPMSEQEVDRAVAEAIGVTGASSIRDMGKVMAHLKARHTGRMDFARAGAAIKQAFR
jgi:uncharacterized protein YqeY